MKRFVAAVLVSACGYHAVYGNEGNEKFHVALKRSLVPDAVASDEVLSGVREALAREGALAAGEGYPRIEVEVLRSDETSDAIAAPTAQPAASALSSTAAPIGAGPRARATEVGLLGRACLVRAPNGPCERDTGDIRAMDLAASDVPLSGSVAATDAFHHRDALRDVGMRLGERLAAHVLGRPTANDEAIGRER